MRQCQLCFRCSVIIGIKLSSLHCHSRSVSSQVCEQDLSAVISMGDGVTQVQNHQFAPSVLCMKMRMGKDKAEDGTIKNPSMSSSTERGTQTLVAPATFLSYLAFCPPCCLILILLCLPSPFLQWRRQSGGRRDVSWMFLRVMGGSRSDR